MNDKTQPSCWGLTAKAMIGIAGLMVLAYLVGGPDRAVDGPRTTAVLAAG